MAFPHFFSFFLAQFPKKDYFCIRLTKVRGIAQLV